MHSNRSQAHASTAIRQYSNPNRAHFFQTTVAHNQKTTKPTCSATAAAATTADSTNTTPPYYAKSSAAAQNNFQRKSTINPSSCEQQPRPKPTTAATDRSATSHGRQIPGHQSTTTTPSTTISPQ